MKKIYKVEVREEKSSEGYENKRYNVHSFELCRTSSKAYLNKKITEVFGDAEDNEQVKYRVLEDGKPLFGYRYPSEIKNYKL